MSAHGYAKDQNITSNDFIKWLKEKESPINPYNLKLQSKKVQSTFDAKNYDESAIEMDLYDAWLNQGLGPIDGENFLIGFQSYNRMISSRKSINQSFADIYYDGLVEPIFAEKILKNKELKIKYLLQECAKIIGHEEWENDININSNGYASVDDYYENPNGPVYEVKSFELFMRLQPHKLSHYMYKCANFLYDLKSNPYYYQIKDMHYLKDFEYDRALTSSEHKVEKLYEQIYLAVKNAGLLYKIDNTYIPKSFLRKHADKSGLTLFIYEREAIEGKKLNHKILAIEFFGSREVWLKNLNEFIEKTMD